MRIMPPSAPTAHQRSLHALVVCLTGIFGLLPLLHAGEPVEIGPPAKIDWSDTRVENDDLNGVMVNLTFTPDQDLAAAEVLLGASLANYLSVVSPVGPIAAVADAPVAVTLQLLQTPDEAGHTLGGVLRVQEDGKNLAKALSVSLKKTEQGGGQGGEDPEEAGGKAFLTWTPPILSDDALAGVSAQPSFSPSMDLADVEIWLSGGLRRCLELSGVTEFAAVAQDADQAFTVELLTPLAELEKPCSGTIHVRGNKGNKRTYAAPLPVRIGVPAEEENEAPIIAEAITDGASFEQRSIAPGQLVSIFGDALGPDHLVVFQVGPDGVNTELEGVLVFFDGLPAPILSAISTQINAIVPQEIVGVDAEMTIIRNGLVSASFPVPAVAVAPNLFTLDVSGFGPAAAVHPDGSLLTSANPAAIGSVVSLFASGAGPVAPTLADGEVAGMNPLWLAGVVSATIGGLPSVVQYAGSAPGIVNGVSQWNLTIPAGLGPGDHAVVITVNGIPSNGLATVSVQ